MAIIPTQPSSVYLASPLTTYRTPRYDRMVDAARAAVTDATILPARGLFFGARDWLIRWPAVLATLSGVVFFTDEAGWIGKGVFTELMDAAAAGLPIGLLTDDGAVHPPDAFAITDVDEEDWRQYARIMVAPENGVRR